MARRVRCEIRNEEGIASGLARSGGEIPWVSVDHAVEMGPKEKRKEYKRKVTIKGAARGFAEGRERVPGN